MRINDNDIIEVSGQQFRVNFEDEYYPEYPWDNDDGCGIVRRSNKPHRDGQSDKKPGERPLNQAGSNEYQFYFDWQAAMKKAKADGWNTEPYDAPNKTLRAVEQNFDYLRGFINGDWCYLSVTVTMVDEFGNDMDEYSDSLGMVESFRDYHISTAYDMVEEIARQFANDAEKEKQSRRFNDAMACGV
jgi:hypothetical protein